MSVHSTLKRKREQSSGSVIPLTPSSSHENVRAPDQDLLNSDEMPDLAFHIPNLSKPYQSLVKILENGKAQCRHPYVLKNQKTYLRVAQLLADQIVQQDAAIFNSKLFPQARYTHRATESYSHSFEAGLSQTLPGAKQLDLKRFACIGEESLVHVTNFSSQNTGKPSVVPPQSTSPLDEVDQPFTINPSMVRVQRMQAQIDISTPALQFWEELGLAPASSEKNIIAFCICPESKFVEERVMCFLDSVSSTYQSCNLGAHHLGFGSAGHGGALISVPTSSNATEAFIERLFEACGMLGKYLRIQMKTCRS